MNTEYKNLLRLLEAFIKEQPPKIMPDANFKEIERLAALHTVSSIIGFEAKQYSLPIQPEHQKQLIHTCLSGIVFFSQKAAAMDMLIEQMNQAQIPHILFKGFVLRNYYPVPELRNFGDIDIIIKPEDRKKSHELMLSLGYRASNMKEPTYGYTKPGEYYEIHTAVCTRKLSQKIDLREYFQNMWNYTIPFKNYQYTYTFTPEYHFIYLLTHIVKHIGSLGAGIRMYMDIAIYILHFQDTLDWKWIHQELKTTQLYDFACMILSTVKDWFHIEFLFTGLPFSIPSLSEEFSDRFLEYTMESGIFGKNVRTVSESMNSIQETETARFSKITLLRKRLFPSVSHLEAEYAYLKRFPFLLPAAWIQRIFRGRVRKKQYIDEFQKILSLDQESLNNIQQLYKELGL